MVPSCVVEADLAVLGIRRPNGNVENRTLLVKDNAYIRRATGLTVN